MKVVANVDRYPGICAATGTSEGRFVQTDLSSHVERGDEVFLSAQLVADAAAALGWLSPDAAAFAGQQQLALDRVKAELAALQEQHTTLIDRVGYTLQQGAVVRGNKVHLRIPPWERATKARKRRNAP